METTSLRDCTRPTDEQRLPSRCVLPDQAPSPSCTRHVDRRHRRCLVVRTFQCPRRLQAPCRAGEYSSIQRVHDIHSELAKPYGFPPAHPPRASSSSQRRIIVCPALSCAALIRLHRLRPDVLQYLGFLAFCEASVLADAPEQIEFSHSLGRAARKIADSLCQAV